MEDWEIAKQFAFPAQVFERFNLKRDAILSGSRGSGKSMILRFFSFKTQADYYKKYGAHYLFEELNIIGTYLKMRGGIAHIGQSDTVDMGEAENEQIIAQFNIMFLRQLGKELKFAQDYGLIDKSNDILLAFPFLFSSSSEKKDWDDFFNVLTDEWANLKEAWRLGNRPAKGWLFNPEILNEVSFYLLKNGYTKDKFLAILIDEVDRLSNKQQKVLNTFLEVNKPPLCFKLGTIPYRWSRETMMGELENPHDFDLCEIDRELKEYEEFLKDLCQKRFSDVCQEDVDIEKDILGNDYSPTRSQLRKEFEKDSTEGATFFTENLRGVQFKKMTDDEIRQKKKTIMQYYGFRTCANLSSGITRSFITLVREILLSAEIKGKWEINKGVIGKKIQDEVIEKRSEEFKNSASSSEKDFSDILKIVDYFGELCHKRFWNDKSGEGECVRIEIKDFYNLKGGLQEILKKCVASGLLQEEKTKRRSTYDEGMGTTKFYLLNMSLAPLHLIPPIDHQTVRLSSSDLNVKFTTEQSRLEIFNQTSPENFDKAINDDKAKNLLRELNMLQTGRKNSEYIKHQKIVEDLLQYLFNDDLVLVGTQAASFSGVRISDSVFRNDARHEDFWKNMKAKHQAEYIIIDAKNSKEPDPSEFNTIAGYLNDNTGFLAIVPIRGIKNIPKKLLKKAEDIYKDNSDTDRRKLLLIINDEDFTKMCNIKSAGDENPSQILQDRYDYFIIRL